MPTLTCPACESAQEVEVSVDTYVVVCEHCGNQFDIPREHRVNKREVQKYTSSVNIRTGYREDGETLHVAWTVQSAEKGNQYLEKDAVSVDVSEHPQKTYWYVALFKALQHVGEYKSARIWVKHNQVLDHLSGEVTLPESDLREQLAETITGLCDEKFLGCEFATTDHVGHDIEQLLS